MSRRVGLIGYGRFGKTLADLLRPAHDIVIYDCGDKLLSAPELLSTAIMQETIFLAIPISAIEAFLQQHGEDINPQATVIDTCSVKRHPVAMMERYLPASVGIIASHPMFGPDSVMNSTALRLVLHAARDYHGQHEYWRNYFTRDCNMTVLDMTPDEHDRYTARSQTITHLMGRLLERVDIAGTPIDTLGFTKLLELTKQTNRDPWQLFIDLIRYNPYSETVLDEIKTALDNLYLDIHDSNT